MSEVNAQIKLSPAQAIVLDEGNVSRLAEHFKKNCDESCRLSIETSGQLAVASCRDCIKPDIPKVAGKLVSRLASSLILDSSLVDPDTAKALPPEIVSTVEMVTTDYIPEKYLGMAEILIGEAATVFRGSGYVRVDDDTLFFAESANDQSLIEPGTPVLIEHVEG